MHSLIKVASSDLQHCLSKIFPWKR